jgi:hypothetical protein
MTVELICIFKSLTPSIISLSLIPSCSDVPAQKQRETLHMYEDRSPLQ